MNQQQKKPCDFVEQKHTKRTRVVSKPKIEEKGFHRNEKHFENDVKYVKDKTGYC